MTTTVTEQVYVNESVTGKFSMPVGQRIIWIFIIIQGCIACYVSVVLIYHECIVTSTHKNLRTKRARCLRWLLIFAALSTVVFFAAVIGTALPIKLERISDRLCQILVVLRKLTYIVPMYSIYMFLWLRQKLFYSNPVMHHLYDRKLKTVSWTIFTLLIACFSAQATLTLLGPAYPKKTTVGCSNALWLTKSQVLLSATTSAVLHFSLLMLFVYPLVQHNLQTNTVLSTGGSVKKEVTTDSRSSFRMSLRSSISKTPNRQGSSRNRQKARKRQKRLIFRCMRLTLCCVCVNIAATVMTATLFRSQNSVASLVYSCNLLVNIVCSVGFFSQWKVILAPFCRNYLSQEMSSSNFETTSKANNNYVVQSEVSDQFLKPSKIYNSSYRA